MMTTLTPQQRDRIAKRYTAIRQAVANAVSMHAPMMLKVERPPKWFKRLLDDCHSEADSIALKAKVAAPRDERDAVYIETFAATLPGLLRTALVKIGKRDPTA
jgi:hypothetical protein